MQNRKDQPRFPLSPVVVPALHALVLDLRSSCSLGTAPQPERITAALGAAVAAGGWLPPDQRRANHERYARHLVYADPRGHFSVLAIVCAPGQASPIHAHYTWCGVAVYQGTLTETFYELAKGKPAESRRTIRVQGSTSFDSANRAIHQFANRGTGNAISLHVYGVGGDRVSTGINRIFDSR